MVIGDFNWKKVPNGHKAYDGSELEDYVLVNPEMEKYCIYDSKYYFIEGPRKKNGLYRVIEGSVYYNKEIFNLSVCGDYIKPRSYACSDAMRIVPWYRDDITEKYFNIFESTCNKIAIFETLEEAQKMCNSFNKELKEKRKKESLEKDMEEYERLKNKLGL